MTGPTHPVALTRQAPATSLRVVVVDDHPLYRQGLVRALEAAGETVVAEACDGMDALMLIRRHRPDVALVDVRMPGLDGIDVTDDLARNGPAVPVVLLSAFDDGALIRRGLEAGATAFITKDADRDEILHAVRSAAASADGDAPAALRSGATSHLSEDERWLLRIADAGMLHRADMAAHTGFSEARVVMTLKTAIDKLGAADLPHALVLADRAGRLRPHTQTARPGNPLGPE
jgi:two-component system nitrate/nitrite response regulator NarL